MLLSATLVMSANVILRYILLRNGGGSDTISAAGGQRHGCPALLLGWRLQFGVADAVGGGRVRTVLCLKAW